MRPFRLFLLISLFFSFNMVIGQNVQTDYIEALNLSRQQNKGMVYIFIDDSNSAAQKEFEKNFLKSGELEKLESRYVILEVNCSQPNDQSSVDGMYCRRLTGVYNTDMVFPSVIATSNKQSLIGGLQSDFSKSASKNYLSLLKSNN